MKQIDPVNNLDLRPNTLTGLRTLMVQRYAVNNRHLQDIIHDHLQAIDGVEGTNTMVAFEVSFERQVVVPDSATVERYRSLR